MKKLIDILKGIAIGISNIVPGFSGGTMAILVHAYDDLINAVSNIFSHPLKTIKEYWELLIGLILGIVLGVFLIVKIIELFPIYVSFFFTGLIISGVIDTIKTIKTYGKITLVDSLLFLVGAAIIIVLPFLSSTKELELTPLLGIILVIMGIICASAMIIPGISGSLVLMAFGFYNFVMVNIEDFITSLFSFKFESLTPLIITILYALGCIIGIVLASKLIKRSLEKYPRSTYMTVLGLLCASPFTIFYKLNETINEESVNTAPYVFIISAVILVISFALTYLLPKFIKRRD